jgi:hypothetical protein
MAPVAAARLLEGEHHRDSVAGHVRELAGDLIGIGVPVAMEPKVRTSRFQQFERRRLSADRLMDGLMRGIHRVRPPLRAAASPAHQTVVFCICPASTTAELSG